MPKKTGNPYSTSKGGSAYSYSKKGKSGKSKSKKGKSY